MKMNRQRDVEAQVEAHPPAGAHVQPTVQSQELRTKGGQRDRAAQPKQNNRLPKRRAAALRPWPRGDQPGQRAAADVGAERRPATGTAAVCDAASVA